jgi:hypothetical protein
MKKKKCALGHIWTAREHNIPCPCQNSNLWHLTLIKRTAGRIHNENIISHVVTIITQSRSGSTVYWRSLYCFTNCWAWTYTEGWTICRLKTHLGETSISDKSNKSINIPVRRGIQYFYYYLTSLTAWVWNGVHSASWVQLRSYLEEKIMAPA